MKMRLPKKEKYLTRKEAFLKLCAFCAYQERTQNEARVKLKSLAVENSVAEDIISDLITNNFINEERFAQTYAGGKFRIKKWGRIKIEKNMEALGLSPYCIRKGLEEIQEAEYEQTLTSLLIKKKSELPKSDKYILQNKMARFVMGKGYEPELVWRLLKALV